MSQTDAHGADGQGVRPEVEYTQEIRFAVVMYGGSSLAIYMNGVAQELLRLVRATAPERDGDVDVPLAYLSDGALKGSERVYRKLGRMLARGDEEESGERDRRAREGEPLRTRFVVDVLTGTSAGGINAVYLAKALANDQSLDSLMELWRTKGDIGVLLNVESSAKISVGEGERRRAAELDFKNQPASPLNSPRMYWELLDALRGMDEQKGGPQDDGRRPLYAEELDLYVTATDTRGRVLNMRLADKVVQELRHRNVFHFRYRADDEDNKEVNDFKAEHNPFLAFAARCTSAHQAAFEVMNMETGDKIVKGVGEARPSERRHPDPRLQKFYEDYLVRAGNVKLWRRNADGELIDADGRLVSEGGKPVPLSDEEVEAIEAAGRMREKLAEDFHDRFFNDGGTLDNSPFSFVSDVLPFRQTLHPVDRKLLYVEPSPEHPDEADPGNLRWNFVKNAFEGLSTLPSHQTIVEDLARIQARNRLVERVNHILTDLREDLGARNRVTSAKERRPARGLEALRGMRLSELIREHGVSWGGYQRLRIAQVTNDLTLLIARAAGLDEESDEFQAVRYLVRYWRLSRYEDHPEAGESSLSPHTHTEKAPEINFLIDFDLSWTIRRVQFLLRTIDELDCMDDAAERIARAAEHEDLKITWPTAAEAADFRKELRVVRREINRVYARLRDARRRYWARRDQTEPAADGAAARPIYLNPFRDEVDALRVSKALLLELLHMPSEHARKEMIGKFMLDAGNAAAFNALSTEVHSKFKGEIIESVKKCERQLDYRNSVGRLDLKNSVRYVLSFYYHAFEDFDQVTFPIFYSTDVGEETDPIEVFRVSPEDASLLVSEKVVNENRAKGKPRISKLAGTSLGHFGAFFDERYRVNDILWGRLDGAERIISALLPGDANEDRRRLLVGEAHAEIIRETWNKNLSKLEEKDAEGRKLADAVRDAQSRSPGDARLRELEGRLKERGVGALWRRYFLNSAGKGEGADAVSHFKNAFLESYEDERKFSRRRKFELGRSGVRVILKILRSNLKQHSRAMKPSTRALTGALLFVGGVAAAGVGAAKVIGEAVAWIRRLFPRKD